MFFPFYFILATKTTLSYTLANSTATFAVKPAMVFTLTIALASFPSVNGRTLSTTLELNGIDQGGRTCVRMSFTPDNATDSTNGLLSDHMAGKQLEAPQTSKPCLDPLSLDRY